MKRMVELRRSGVGDVKVLVPRLEQVTGGNTDREYIEIDSIAPRLYLLTRMLMELGPGR